MMLIYPEKYLVLSAGDLSALIKQAVHWCEMLLWQTHTRFTGAGGITIKLAVQEQLHSPALEQGSSSAQACLEQKAGGTHFGSWGGGEREQEDFLGRFFPGNPFPSHSSH